MIAVCGLGKLGAPLAAVLAAHKHQVMGFDLDADTVRRVNAGEAPVQETGLDALMEYAHPYLRATTDIAEVVAESSIAFVVVPTPTDSTGQFSNRYVIEAVEAIGAALRDSDTPFYTVAIVSTVMPGSIRGPIRHALEDASGRTCGIDCSLTYSPALIALGSVIHDFTNPDLVLLGSDDPMGPRAVIKVLSPIMENQPQWCVMQSIDAELSKIALNGYIVTKVSYANMLAEICEGIPGADARIVARSIGQDSRIGSRYFAPGANVGGTCFPRDLIALAAFAETIAVEVPLIKAAHVVNEHQVLRIGAKVIDDKRVAIDDKRVAILGLAFKPDTAVTEASLGSRLVGLLEEWEISVSTFDPAAGGTATSAAECIADADAVIVATPWPEFAGVDYQGKRVIDVWGILPPEDNIERIGESLS